MYGAMLGDIIGSPYEFDRGEKTKEFPLFIIESHFTDDSVMTIAVAEALLESVGKTDAEIRKSLITSMQKWGNKYPRAGYGGMFFHWLKSKEPKPYGSYGNGSAMRVSAAGWLSENIEETRRYARLTAEVTHNHPEGIKGAEAVACAIFMARNKKTKDEIKEYIVTNFQYDLQRPLDEIRIGYYHDESCQKTVPEAIIAFLESTSFEDAVRNAVSLGGDTDTLAAIAGSIAEAYYGIPKKLLFNGLSKVPEEFVKIANLCYKHFFNMDKARFEKDIRLHNKKNLKLEILITASVIINLFIKAFDSSIILFLMTFVLCFEWLRREHKIIKEHPLFIRKSFIIIYISIIIFNFVAMSLEILNIFI